MDGKRVSQCHLAAKKILFKRYNFNSRMLILYYCLSFAHGVQIEDTLAHVFPLEYLQRHMILLSGVVLRN